MSRMMPAFPLDSDCLLQEESDFVHTIRYLPYLSALLLQHVAIHIGLAPSAPLCLEAIPLRRINSNKCIPHSSRPLSRLMQEKKRYDQLGSK